MHPLDGPRLKIRRAESQIELLRRAEKAFGRESDYKVYRGEMDPKTGKYVYRVRLHSQQPPPELGVEIGEIAHNLRSALNLLVNALVELAGNAPARSNQFPISLVEMPDGETEPWIGRMTRSALKGVLPKHQAMIEGLQPYQRGKGGKISALYHLQDINNTDKHRILLAVRAKPLGVIVGYKKQGEIRHVSAWFPILKDGAKVLEAPPAGVQVHPKLTPLIAFGDGPLHDLAGVSVLVVLGYIFKEVVNILEAFEPEFPA